MRQVLSPDSPEADVISVGNENLDEFISDTGGHSSGEEQEEGVQDEGDRPREPIVDPQEKKVYQKAARDLKKAKEIIADTLEDAKLEKDSVESEMVAEADLDGTEESLGSTLSQGREVKVALREVNKLVEERKYGGLINATDWPATNKYFNPGWFKTHGNAYSTGKTVVEDALRKWSHTPMSGFPPALEKVSYGLHHAISTGGFVNQATATMFRKVQEMGEAAPDGMLELAAATNRAATNSFSQAFFASASLDMHRRDVALDNTRLNTIARGRLRASPLGSSNVFDPATAISILEDKDHAYALINKEKGKSQNPFPGKRAGGSGHPARKDDKPANNYNQGGNTGGKRKRRRGKRGGGGNGGGGNGGSRPRDGQRPSSKPSSSQ